jgi:aspartyl/asparaginyl beta-hydroxylase (cupin superfamily)
MATAVDPAEAVRVGVAALQRGDAAEARRRFEAVIAEGKAPPPYILLAQACRIAGDFAAEEAALDRLLATEPRNLRALIMKGDCIGRRGEARAAASWYSIALQAAAASPAAVSPNLALELQRAERMIAEASARYERHLTTSLAERGVDEAALSPRVRESIDLLTEKKQVYLQQPSSFFLPRLPHIQFFEREAFAWLAELEAATDAIRAELLAVLEEDGAFRPYVEAEPDRPRPRHILLDDPRWGAFDLMRNGAMIEENARRCPATMAALAHVPLAAVKGRGPMALFSMLRPRTRIPPHHGLLNTRLICHLPLIVPPGCALRVGNEVREWTPGETLVFDDSIEHEAWNDSDETRVVLIFEIWRPELSAGERAALTALFEAIDAFSGRPPAEAGA